MRLTVSARQELDGLLDKKDFFLFRDRLELLGADLSQEDLLYYSAYRFHLFGDSARSDSCVREFFDQYGDSAAAERKAELLKIKGDNLMRMYRYGEAADTYSGMLSRYGDIMEEDERKEVENNIMLWNTVRGVPPQTVSIDRDILIPFEYNRFSHMLVEVGTPCGVADFVFDTGANLSTVTETCALRMGMTIYEADVEVVTSTDIKVHTKLAVADRFRVGDLVFRNVVFLLLADDQLAFPEIGYGMEGVIGFPVICQMRELRIGSSAIEMPAVPVCKDMKNLCLEGLMPVVRAETRGESLTFTLDTGANKSELSRRYYERHKNDIENKGIRSENRRGGVIYSPVYELKDFELAVGGQRVELPEINVSLDGFLFNKDKDGNMGQDIFRWFGQMILSFEHMYLLLDAPVP